MTSARARFRRLLTALRVQLGITLPLDALVSLVMTFNLGIIIERLGGIDTGHSELLDWIERWISR